MDDHHNPAEELLAYRELLARRLRELRMAATHSTWSASLATDVLESMIIEFEAAQRLPSLTRLRALVGTYGSSLRSFLAQLGIDLGLGPDAVEQVLFLHGNVTPGQAARFGRDPVVQDGVEPPQTKDVVFLRHDHPLRLLVAQGLRVRYERGESLRDLTLSEQVSYGAIRGLLLKAGTTLRPPGPNRP